MSDNSPKISIVIPAYNASQYIEAAIQSVFCQTFTDWELIIIDDGSTDDTANLVSRYAQQDPRIVVVHKKNEGVSIARNLGVELSKGDLVAFLDADDRWTPEKLSVHLDHFLSDEKLGVSFAKVRYIRHDGSPTNLIARCPFKNLESWHFLYGNPTVTTSNIVARREVFSEIGGFDPNINYSEDMDWCFQVMQSSTWKIEGIDSVLVDYRISTNGLSSSLYKMEEGWKQFAAKARVVSPALMEAHYDSAYSDYLRYLARQSLRLNLPANVGVKFINRALHVQWKMVFRKPRQAILIIVAVYANYLSSNLFSTFEAKGKKL